jgi:hypothetical protein
MHLKQAVLYIHLIYFQSAIYVNSGGYYKKPRVVELVRFEQALGLLPQAHHKTWIQILALPVKSVFEMYGMNWWFMSYSILVCVFFWHARVNIKSAEHSLTKHSMMNNIKIDMSQTSNSK